MQACESSRCLFFSKKHSWDAQNRAFCLSGWVPATGHNKEHWWRHMLHMNFHGFRGCSTCCCGILKPTGARDVSRNITFIFRFKIFFLPHDYHLSMLHVTCADDTPADLVGTHAVIVGDALWVFDNVGRYPSHWQFLQWYTWRWKWGVENFGKAMSSVARGLSGHGSFKKMACTQHWIWCPVLDKFRRVDESQKAVRKLSIWLPHWIRLLYISCFLNFPSLFPFILPGSSHIHLDRSRDCLFRDRPALLCPWTW